MPSIPSSIHVELDFDYRSRRFEQDARMLARRTGAPLEDCRQQLFIAEGDVALAHLLLSEGYAVLAQDSALH